MTVRLGSGIANGHRVHTPLPLSATLTAGIAARIRCPLMITACGTSSYPIETTPIGSYTEAESRCMSYQNSVDSIESPPMHSVSFRREMPISLDSIGCPPIPISGNIAPLVSMSTPRACGSTKHTLVWRRKQKRWERSMSSRKTCYPELLI